ncbi:MAG: 23S rRNA (guanosine(2251)-2'-O)-methyltransferase RlmB [Elusimicrobia bacterium]|nr:23S rRNA (guanosine(2251)-2'-O)-methyltransferase RlmB [Elusimicrobiota bacterium]
MFPICGKRAVAEALRSKRAHAFKNLLIAESRDRVRAPARRADEETVEGRQTENRDSDVEEIFHLAKQRGVGVKTASAEELTRWAPGWTSHQGMVLLLAKEPRPLSLDDLIGKISGQERAFLVALDGVTDHQNIGAIARSAACFGVAAILAPEDRAAPLIHPATWRVAQGAAEHLEFCNVVNLSRALQSLKDAGFWIVGAASQGGKGPEALGGWPKKLCLVLGSEEKGLRRLVAETCDFLLTFPQERPGGLDSLNLASAAAILFWEVYRSEKIRR